MSIQAILGDAATRAGLTRRTDASDEAFGTRKGFAVQLRATKHEGKDCLLFVARVQEGQVGPMRDKIDGDRRLAAANIKPSAVHVEGDLVSYGFVRPSFGRIDPTHVVEGVDAILGAIGDAVPPPPAVCRGCGSDVGATPMLLNGIVDRMCEPCVAKIKAAAGQNAADYQRRTLHVARALGAAAGLSLAGAAVWAAVAVIFDLQLWPIAGGIGWAIGFVTLRAAGKGGRFVQILSAGAGLLSPLLGMVGASVFLAARQDPSLGPVEVIIMFILGPLILVEMGSVSLYAAGAGLLGGALAAEMAKKPTFELKVVR